MRQAGVIAATRILAWIVGRIRLSERHTGAAILSIDKVIVSVKKIMSIKEKSGKVIASPGFLSF